MRSCCTTCILVVHGNRKSQIQIYIYVACVYDARYNVNILRERKVYPKKSIKVIPLKTISFYEYKAHRFYLYRIEKINGFHSTESRVLK